MIHLAITPVPKPRMTQRDKWQKRPCVIRYRDFCDEVRNQMKGQEFPQEGAYVIFYLPMPKSWSKKKKREMQLKPHQQKPDVDNLCKALLDALYGDDSHIYDIRISKYWALAGAINIEPIELEKAA